MTQMTHGVSPDTRTPLILGAVLIVVGLAGFLTMVFPDSGGIIVLAIGLGMLVLFAITRTYGWLVAGGIVTGLGAGILATEYGPAIESGALVVGGLGLGFLSIWVLGALSNVKEQHPWPLIPGTILLTVATGLWIQAETSLTFEWWPLLLIAIGGMVIVAGLAERRRT